MKIIKDVLVKENQLEDLKSTWHKLNESEKECFLPYIKKYIYQAVKKYFPEQLEKFRCNNNILLKVLEN